MDIRVETCEAEFIIAQYLEAKGCVFDKIFSGIEGRSSLVRFQDNEQEDGEYYFKASVVIPISFKSHEEISDGSQ